MALDRVVGEPVGIDAGGSTGEDRPGPESIVNA